MPRRRAALNHLDSVYAVSPPHSPACELYFHSALFGSAFKSLPSPSPWQLPAAVQPADPERAEERPGPGGHVQDTNVQVCRRLLRERLPPLQRPDLPQHRGAVPARE